MATSRPATYSCRSSSTAGDVTVHAPTGNEQPKELSLPVKSPKSTRIERAPAHTLPFFLALYALRWFTRFGFAVHSGKKANARSNQLVAMRPTYACLMYLSRRLARFAMENESWHSAPDPEPAYSLAPVEPLGEGERRASAECDLNRIPLQRRGAMDSTVSTGTASDELVHHWCALKRFQRSQTSNLNKCLHLKLQHRRRTTNKNRSSTVDNDDGSKGFAVAEVPLGSFCTYRL